MRTWIEFTTAELPHEPPSIWIDTDRLERLEDRHVAGLERLRANKADALAEAAIALDNVKWAKTAVDHLAASGKVRAALDTADRVVRVLQKEGEL